MECCGGRSRTSAFCQARGGDKREAGLSLAKQSICLGSMSRSLRRSLLARALRWDPTLARSFANPKQTVRLTVPELLASRRYALVRAEKMFVWNDACLPVQADWGSRLVKEGLLYLPPARRWHVVCGQPRRRGLPACVPDRASVAVGFMQNGAPPGTSPRIDGMLWTAFPAGVGGSPDVTSLPAYLSRTIAFYA